MPNQNQTVSDRCLELYAALLAYQIQAGRSGYPPEYVWLNLHIRYLDTELKALQYFNRTGDKKALAFADRCQAQRLKHEELLDTPAA